MTLRQRQLPLIRRRVAHNRTRPAAAAAHRLRGRLQLADRRFQCRRSRLWWLTGRSRRCAIAHDIGRVHFVGQRLDLALNHREIGVDVRGRPACWQCCCGLVLRKCRLRWHTLPIGRFARPERPLVAHWVGCAERRSRPQRGFNDLRRGIRRRTARGIAKRWPRARALRIFPPRIGLRSVLRSALDQTTHVALTAFAVAGGLFGCNRARIRRLPTQRFKTLNLRLETRDLCRFLRLQMHRHQRRPDTAANQDRRREGIFKQHEQHRRCRRCHQSNAEEHETVARLPGRFLRAFGFAGLRLMCLRLIGQRLMRQRVDGLIRQSASRQPTSARAAARQNASSERLQVRFSRHGAQSSQIPIRSC